MRPSVRRLEITILFFKMPLPSPLSQQTPYKTLYSSQTLKDDLLFTMMIDLRFSFFPSVVVAGRYSSLDNLNILFLWPNLYCSNKWHVSFTVLQNKCLHQSRYLWQQAVLLLSMLLQSTQNESSLVGISTRGLTLTMTLGVTLPLIVI